MASDNENKILGTASSGGKAASSAEERIKNLMLSAQKMREGISATAMTEQEYNALMEQIELERQELWLEEKMKRGKVGT